MRLLLRIGSALRNLLRKQHVETQLDVRFVHTSIWSRTKNCRRYPRSRGTTFSTVGVWRHRASEAGSA